jgi:hypothetical protein
MSNQFRPNRPNPAISNPNRTDPIQINHFDQIESNPTKPDAKQADPIKPNQMQLDPKVFWMYTLTHPNMEPGRGY